MKNYALKIQYDGTDFHGWQIQSNVATIQETIKNAIEVLVKHEVNLIGSGRTDAGVHALGQIANFESNIDLDLFRLKHSLNSILPQAISIREIVEVDPDFHSRFGARKRSYLYIFCSEKSPFYNKYSLRRKFTKNEIDTLNESAKELIGEYDYSAFAKKNEEVKNLICDVKNIRWTQRSGLTFVIVESSRFLHGMVRAIVGTLLHSLSKENPAIYLREVLNSKQRSNAAQSVPSKGLFLYKVRYPNVKFEK